MEPPPERSIAGTTAFMPRKQPVLVDLNVPLPERVVGLHQRGRLVDPGVVDQAVQAAELLGGFDGAGPIGFRGHIVPDEGRGRPELDRQRLALIVQHVADHHLRTLRYQQAGLRGTLAARPAAHEHHLVVEACHVRSPLHLPTSGVWRIGPASSRPGDLECHFENYLAGFFAHYLAQVCRCFAVTAVTWQASLGLAVTLEAPRNPAISMASRTT